MIDRVVVINDLAQPMGGASQLAIDSARGLARRNIPVTFLSGDAAPSDGEGIEFLGLGQERLLTAGMARSLVRGIYNTAARRMVADWIARNDRPGTVYHLHGWSQILSPSVLDALQAVMDRTVITAHDYFLSCPNGAQFNYRSRSVCKAKPLSLSCLTSACDRRSRAQKAWRLARHAVQRTLLAPAKAPLILLIHKEMQRSFELAGYPSSQLRTLPNPIEPYTPERIEAEANHHILFVGRMEQTKGIHLLAAACRKAGIGLIGLGAGSMLEALREDYPEFTFPGRIEPSAIAPYASQCRMLAMPSLHMEPFGLSAVEALWSGLPVLSSHLSLIAPNIAQAGAGLSVDPCDEDAFAGAIADLAGNDSRVRRMSEAAFVATRHLAHDYGDWIDNLVAHYETLPTQAKANSSGGEATARGGFEPRGLKEEFQCEYL